jgi:hypothetical protein
LVRMAVSVDRRQSIGGESLERALGALKTGRDVALALSADYSTLGRAAEAAEAQSEARAFEEAASDLSRSAR